MATRPKKYWFAVMAMVKAVMVKIKVTVMVTVTVTVKVTGHGDCYGHRSWSRLLIAVMVTGHGHRL